MSPGRFAFALLGLVLLTALPGAAETIREDVGDHTVTVYVLEQETTHNTFETSSSEFMHHREERTSGVWVDDQGVNATVSNTTRTLDYDDGTYQSDRHEERASLSVRGEALGFRTYQQARVDYIDRSFDFGEDLNGEAKHVIVIYDGNTHGNDLLLRNGVRANPGAGDLVTPEEGDVYFVNGGASTDQRLRVDETSFLVGGGAGHDTFLGDWTGSYVSLSVYEAHCEGFNCQYTSIGQSMCLVGYQPPFFITCGI